VERARERSAVKRKNTRTNWGKKSHFGRARNGVCARGRETRSAKTTRVSYRKLSYLTCGYFDNLPQFSRVSVFTFRTLVYLFARVRVRRLCEAYVCQMKFLITTAVTPSLQETTDCVSKISGSRTGRFQPVTRWGHVQMRRNRGRGSTPKRITPSKWRRISTLVPWRRI
jgi:hypothetical protein